MKKIIFTFLVLIFNINFTYAGKCSISDETSPALLEYITNNRKIVSEITNQTIKSNSDNSFYGTKGNVKEFYSNVKSTSIQIYNEAFNYNGYGSYFEYFAVYPISNEVPYEVRRDYSLLKEENEGLKEYVDTIISTCKDDVIIESICKKAINNHSIKCKYSDSIKNTELIGKLIYNNDRILDLYRKTVIGKTDNNPEKYEFQLVSSNFESEITTNYSIKNYSLCSDENGGFFERIKESFFNIWEANKEAEDGIKKWNEALELIKESSSNSEEMQALERKLLKEELSRQGINGDSQQNMLDALDKYNSPEGFSLKNRFIDSTYNSISKSVTEQFQEFIDDVIGDFFDSENTEPISVEELNRVSSNSDLTISIARKVQTLYATQSAYEGISEYNTSNTRTRLINTYNEVSNSINTLNTTTCEIAKRICESQDSKRGDCGKCN